MRTCLPDRVDARSGRLRFEEVFERAKGDCPCHLHPPRRPLLKSAELQPHRSQYWLNAIPKDAEAFSRQVRERCDCYRAAPARLKSGVRTVYVDEMTGVRATERMAPAQPMRPGQVEKVEFDHKRHGTRCPIGNLGVAAGRLMWRLIDGPRTLVQQVGVIADPGLGFADVGDIAITVRNVAPSIRALPARTANVGATLSIEGRFDDPGADTWTATVDCGDGSGPKPLALNSDRSYVLTHA